MIIAENKTYLNRRGESCGYLTPYKPPILSKVGEVLWPGIWKDGVGRLYYDNGIRVNSTNVGYNLVELL